MTHSEDALQTALAIEETLEGASFGVGVGIETGMAMAGDLGVGDVCDFTCVGEPVNVASRLQALARPGEIVVGPNAWRQVADLIEVRGIPWQVEVTDLKGLGRVEIRRLRPLPPAAATGSS